MIKTEDLFRNCLQVKETEQGWQPLRFTDLQFDLYAEENAYKLRSLCPAGITLECLTNSAELQFDYVVHGKTRDYLSFEVYVNDCLHATIGHDHQVPDKDTFYFKRDISSIKQLDHIKIYLPHNAAITLSNIHFSADAQIEAVAPMEKHLLSFGDSITQGMDAKRPTSLYPVQLAQRLGYGLLNQGVGGYYFNAASLDNKLGAALNQQPDLITVLYGTNDWGKVSGRQEMAERVEAYFNKLHQLFPETRKVVITPFWRANWREEKAMGNLREVHHIIEQKVSAYSSIKLIDGFEISPHDPLHYADGLHPNDEGFFRIIQALCKQLER
jgi:lysophospholipase L1-like esterase